MFGELNEQHKAQMALDTIRQRGSAANYTAEFQRIAFHTGYDAAALCASYYKGLKSEVKDDMARGDMPIQPVELARLAVQIDERQHQRRQEKRGEAKGQDLEHRFRKA